jgi:hypothetical protein
MTITKFYVACCTTCEATILLIHNYKELGFKWEVWSDLNAEIKCCTSPDLEQESSVTLEDPPPEPPEIPIFDRVTLVLEDLQEGPR